MKRTKLVILEPIHHLQIMKHQHLQMMWNHLFVPKVQKRLCERERGK